MLGVIVHLLVTAMGKSVRDGHLLMERLLPITARQSDAAARLKVEGAAA